MIQLFSTLSPSSTTSTKKTENFFPFDAFVKWLSYGNDAVSSSSSTSSSSKGSATARAAAVGGSGNAAIPARASRDPRADPGFLSRRELCYTLDGDIFVRYQSVRDASDLRRALLAKVPAKIDIGPVYNVDPSRRAAYNSSTSSAAASAASSASAGAPASGFAPMERELVFDIDLTDYDDVRTCGTGGHTCRRCWPLMAAAVAVVDAALREDFGFSLVLWVFSGRRGVHAWVCDPRARRLTDEQRAAVAANLSLYKGVEDGVVKLALPGAGMVSGGGGGGGGGAPGGGATTTSSSSSSASFVNGGNTSHPAVARSLRLLRPLWESQILPRQKLLDSAKTWDKILGHLPDASLAARLRSRWDRARENEQRENVATDDGVGGGGGGGGEEEEGNNPEASSLSLRRWRELEAEVARASRPSAADARDHAARDRKAALATCLDRAVLACSYPRLDVDVSKKRNHLLKAPFCVHPRTGKVCVPIAASKEEGHEDVAAAAASFDVDAVPTAAGLLDSLDDKAVAERERRAREGGAGGAAGASSPAAAAASTAAAPKWEGTALGPYISAFDEFVRACSAEGKAENARRAAARRAAAGEASLAW